MNERSDQRVLDNSGIEVSSDLQIHKLWLQVHLNQTSLE